MVVIWFIAFLVFLVIELVTVNLVTIWFAIGSIAAIISTMYTNVIAIQLLVFFLMSLSSLLVTRPIMKKFRKFEVTPTNSDRVIGQIGEVTSSIEKNKYGEVKIYGNTWTATSEEEIPVGEKVKVLSIDGVKLIVEKEKK